MLATFEVWHTMVISGLTNQVWRRICELYKIPTDAKVIPLGGTINRSYQISMPGRTKQVLRLYQPGIRTRQAIHAELMVLAYLSQASDLKVPSPIENKLGQFFTTINENNEPEPTQIAMFSYVSGEVIEGVIPSSDMMFRIGQTLGQLDLALYSADLAIDPSPSKSRRRWGGEASIDSSLKHLTKHQADYDFLQEDTYGKGLHPTILEIADRLRSNYSKLKHFLPHQLLHLDAHLGNLMFDGSRIGILDFDNMGYGPRLYELVAPLWSIYWLEMSSNLIDHSSSMPLLTEALLAGYGVHIQLSDLELQGLSLVQAMKLFTALGWTVQQKDLPRLQRWLVLNGAGTVKRCSTLLDAYEKSLVFSRSDMFRMSLHGGKNTLIKICSLQGGKDWSKLPRALFRRIFELMELH